MNTVPQRRCKRWSKSSGILPCKTQTLHLIPTISMISLFSSPNLVTPEYKNMERYIQGLLQPIQGLDTTSKPTKYDSAKRLDFNLTNQEIHQYTMIQKAELPKSKSRKRESEGDSKQSTFPLPMSLRQYVGDLPLCNESHYRHICQCRELVYNKCG